MMNRTLPPEVVQKVNEYLDSERFIQAARELGRQLFDTLLGGGEDNRGMAQLRNLQQVAMTARRLADIEDFVKNQMGRDIKVAENWRQVGPEVLRQLGELRKRADAIATDEAVRLQVRLLLAHGWVRTVVGSCLYEKARKQTGVAAGRG